MENNQYLNYGAWLFIERKGRDWAAVGFGERKLRREEKDMLVVKGQLLVIQEIEVIMRQDKWPIPYLLCYISFSIIKRRRFPTTLKLFLFPKPTKHRAPTIPTTEFFIPPTLHFPLSQSHNISLPNKNNMLQTFTPRPPRSSLFPKENSFPRPTYKNTYNQHILNLNITQDIPTPSSKYKTIDSNYKTAYNNTNISWKAAHTRHVNRAEVGGTGEHANGQSVVGTPFTCVEFEGNQSGNGMFLTERQHYRYLVKAISGLRRGRQIYDNHKYKELQNPQHYRSIFSHETKPNRYAAGYGFTGISPSHENETNTAKNGICTSPKIVNISAQIKSRKGARSSLETKGNLFQNIFKNKRRLQSRYYQGKIQADHDFELSILGDEELQIHQVAWARTRKHQKQS